MQLNIPESEMEPPSRKAPVAPPPTPPPAPSSSGVTSEQIASGKVVIEPTSQQKQLMRKVSALGMEDPVFGTIDNHLKPLHASCIFDDMDFEDIPEDMKDIIPVASDHTDKVVLDQDLFGGSGQGDGGKMDSILESPLPASMETKLTAVLTSSSESPNHHSQGSLSLSKEDLFGFAPPAGSFAVKSTKRQQHQQQEHAGLTSSAESPNHHSQGSLSLTKEELFDFTPPAGSFAMKSTKRQQQQQDHKDATRSSKSNKRPHPKLPSPPKSNKPEIAPGKNLASFVPPAGSFNRRAPRKSDSSNSRDSFLKEIAIAAQNIAIEAQVEAKIFPEVEKDMTVEDLEISFSNLNSSISSLNANWNIGNKVKSQIALGSLPPKSTTANRRSSAPYDTYVPPTLPSKSVQPNEHRALPSMEAVFMSGASSSNKQTATGEKPKKQAKGEENEVQLTASQLNVEIPLNKKESPVVDSMWASLSQIEDPTSKKKSPRSTATKESGHSKSSSKSSKSSTGDAGKSKRKSRKHKAGRRASNPKQDSTKDKQEAVVLEAAMPVAG